MGLFSGPSSFEADIEKATSATNTIEKWDDIMEICDKAGSSSATAKDCLKAIVRRLNHNDPHVVVQAITLLDACVSNCKKTFHLEVASREFETEFQKLLKKPQLESALLNKLKALLKKWAENDFKSDPQLHLIPSLYNKLKSEGMDFNDLEAKPSVSKTQVSFDPNVVESQKEADDIAKAIELSLKDKGGSPMKQSSYSTSANTTSSSSSLYPTASLNTNSTVSEARKVRALYDFEAAEDNELTFMAGEFIQVLDDSDPNWWKGFNHRGEGLFPSNFVTADLSVEPESLRLDLAGGSSSSKAKKFVQFSDDFKKDEDLKPEIVEINEEKIDRLLHLLHEANPEDPSQDTEEMLNLENTVNQMGPLIDTELERVDRTHAQLTQLSSSLVEAFNLYHTLMRESDRPMSMPYNPHQSMYGPPGMVMNPEMPGMFPPMHHQMPPHPMFQHQQAPPQHPALTSMSHPTSAHPMPLMMPPPTGYQPHPNSSIPPSFPSQQQQQQQPNSHQPQNPPSNQQNLITNGSVHINSPFAHHQASNSVVPNTNPGGGPPSIQHHPQQQTGNPTGLPQGNFMINSYPGNPHQPPPQQQPNIQMAVGPTPTQFNYNPMQQQQQQPTGMINQMPIMNGTNHLMPNYSSMGQMVGGQQQQQAQAPPPAAPTSMNNIPVAYQ